jgi:hypothetical protein
MRLQNGTDLIIGKNYIDNYGDEYKPLYLGGECFFYLTAKGNERCVSYAYAGKVGIKQKNDKHITETFCY